MVLVTTLITILCCFYGLIYNLSTLKVAISGGFEEVEEADEPMDTPYFYPAFYSMSAVCFVFYVCLLAFSVDLISGSFRTLIPFTIVAVLEVIHFVSVAKMWRHPRFGYSVAAASGVANGGLMAQFVILLPLWAPLVLWYAKLSTV